MKKLIITLLFVLMIISGMLFYSTYRINKDVNKKIDDYKLFDIDNKKKAKEDELNKLKEDNKNKIERYEEVEKWNQDILDYLK